jgi:hypothetical protein
MQKLTVGMLVEHFEELGGMGGEVVHVADVEGLEFLYLFCGLLLLFAQQRQERIVVGFV